ncbi:MAG TPA: response regulator [Ktedonobacterales bacterium]
MNNTHPIHILIVDDDRSIRATLRAVLEDEEYNVLEAENGNTALALLQATYGPVVVLLDLRMPGLDGTGVLEAVAADARLATHNAYILITANSHSIPADTSRLLEQLDVPVVPKPFDLDILLETVTEAVVKIYRPDSGERMVSSAIR